MRFKKFREEEPRVSIAPLIDIVFLLLIFFMVTSHFDIASGIRINLPKVAKRIIGEENRMDIGPHQIQKNQDTPVSTISMPFDISYFFFFHDKISFYHIFLVSYLFSLETVTSPRQRLSRRLGFNFTIHFFFT